MSSHTASRLITGYAALAYLAFLATVAWSIAFLADAPVTTGVDDGSRHPALVAAVVDLALLGAFALHHSVMARNGAKRRLTRLVPPAAERSTYVLSASALLALALWQWQPLPRQVWLVDAQPWRALLWAGFILGWIVTVAATFMIDHFDLVGLRQARSHRHPSGYQPPGFRERWLYTWVRHPMMTGLLIAFWCTPAMSVGHLVFALAGTAYIALGVHFEERDLARTLGPSYTEYAARVPAVIPRPGKSVSSRTTLSSTRIR